MYSDEYLMATNHHLEALLFLSSSFIKKKKKKKIREGKLRVNTVELLMNVTKKRNAIHKSKKLIVFLELCIYIWREN